MNQPRPLIVVFGATGATGGAVVRHLRSAWRVRAVTRNPDGARALELVEQGVEVVRGDLDDPDTIAPCLQGAHGVFSVQDFWEHGFEKEVQQGCSLADLAVAAGVQHFVYSSVEGADRNSEIPHFESKWRVEQHLKKQLDLSFTIIRPVFYMENFLKGDLPEQILNGTLALALDPQTRLQMCAVDDIGRLVAQVFGDRNAYLARTLPLAGDELTGQQAAAVFGRVMDRPIDYVELPIEVMRQFSQEMATMFEWYDSVGHSVVLADIALATPTDFEAWLRSTDWRAARALEGKDTDWERDKDDHSTSHKDRTSVSGESPAFGEGLLLGKFCAINYIKAEPHYRERFEALFMDRAHAVDSLQGFLGMQVLRPREEDGEYLVVSWWDRVEDFNAWRTNPAFLMGHRGFGDLKTARKSGQKPPMASRFSTYDVFSE